MKEFHGKVAVVTGAASGIGRALAARCVHEGMKVVLAGINEQTLVQTRQELQAPGAQILAIQTDVSKASEVEALAQQIAIVWSNSRMIQMKRKRVPKVRP